MKLQGDYVFDAPVDAVWTALFDPVVLAAVMPGCEKLELVDGRFKGDLNIKVGPVQGTFQGVVDLKDVQKPTAYTMVVDGRGGPGFVKATAAIRLEPREAGTLLVYDADASVGGRLASIGQRLVDASAKAIIKQSLDGLQQNIALRLKAPAPASASSAGAPSPAPQVVKADPAAFAASVAREVTSSLIPAPARYLLVFAAGLLLGGLAVKLLLAP